MNIRKHKYKLQALIISVPFLIIFIFVGVLGWEKILFRILGILLLPVIFIPYFVYGGLMRYPSPNAVSESPKELRSEIALKRKFLGPYVRVLLLGMSIFGAWAFFDFFKDLNLIITGKDVYEKVVGEITSVETIAGSAPFYQSVELDGDTYHNYVYLNNFHNRFPIGSTYEFTVLKNSKFIVDDKKLKP